MLPLIGWTATALALTGNALLCLKRPRACFVVWICANVLTAAVHVPAGLWSLAFRDAAFTALALWGLVSYRATPAATPPGKDSALCNDDGPST
jgi:nicotinamide riboside transporter PnuC